LTTVQKCAMMVTEKEADVNISFKWCNKVTRCSYCDKDILKDTPLFIHSWKNKQGFSGRIFYHPDCFGIHFSTVLELKVPKPNRSNRGRPNMGLTALEKKKRAILLRTYPKIKYNANELKLVGDALEKLGGVPKSWKLEDYI